MSLKTINATVGQNGANIPADVATIQYLLNCVPFSQGGPQRELQIDGFAGVFTIEAINRFQQFHFGQSIGIVISSDETLSELKKYDPLPNSSSIAAFNSQTMDPSKMNREVGRGGTISTIYVKKSVEGGGIKLTLDPLKGRL